ncbi:MAG: hypothetical protein JW395_1530 [Nitrospira sp.]|nr:hypothetical protein [Nitrospira sp.]
MANGFMQQNPRPASTQHNRHDTRRRFDGRQVEDGFTRRFTRKPQIPAALIIKLEPDAPPPAKRAGLALAVLFSNTSYLQSRKRLHVAN